MNNKEILAQEIRDDEGCPKDDNGNPIAYLEKKSGKMHIAYGHLLDEEQHPDELKAMGLKEPLDDWTGFTITNEGAEELLFIDIDDAIEGLEPSKKYEGWTEEELEALDPERYIALISMAFQLGGEGVRRKFPACVKAIKAEDWDRAADEMLWSNGLLKQRRSQWWKDCGGDRPKEYGEENRCEVMADRMRRGFIETDNIEPIADAPGASVFDTVDVSTLSDAELISAQNKIHAEITKRLGVTYR